MLKIAKGFIRIQKKYSDAIKTYIYVFKNNKSHIYIWICMCETKIWRFLRNEVLEYLFFYAKEQIEAEISITSNIKISFIATDFY